MMLDRMCCVYDANNKKKEWKLKIQSSTKYEK